MRRRVAVDGYGDCAPFHAHRERMYSSADEDCSHPRFSFSISGDLKKRLNASERFYLCDRLSPYFCDALDRWPDNPLIVEVGGVGYRLSDNPGNPGKVLLR